MDRIPHYNLRSTLYPLDDDFNMQANYPKKMGKPFWDRVHVEYPVRKYIETGVSSETIGRRWRPPGEVLKDQKTPLETMKNYFRDYNITMQLTRSQTMEDFGSKQPETKRFSKHTTSMENEYIYPPSRRDINQYIQDRQQCPAFRQPMPSTTMIIDRLAETLKNAACSDLYQDIEERVPQLTAHGTTEMRSSYTPPVTPPRLVTDKDQFKHPATLPQNPPPIEPSWHKELEPLDTTYEGFEKYLDPYLTTSRLHHRPYTADLLERPSCNRDIVTYYTFKDIAYTRHSKPNTEWQLPVPRPKSVNDREKFKQGPREIRSHNKLQWVPGTFRTEARDNYIPPILQPASQIRNLENGVRSYYEKQLTNLPTNLKEEYNAFQKNYSTENSVVGSAKPICSVLDQFKEKNKRLER